MNVSIDVFVSEVPREMDRRGHLTNKLQLFVKCQNELKITTFVIFALDIEITKYNRGLTELTASTSEFSAGSCCRRN